MLSTAGKEILIKAVAQAVPVFAMACFDLTKTLCNLISEMICRYWWSNMDKEHKIHWVSREHMMLPKKEGGLGFRDLHVFNRAMLARQAWRLANAPNSLSARVLSAKYYPSGQIIRAVPKDGMSYSWRSILKGVELLREGVIWRIGNGEKVNIWNHPWIPRGQGRKSATPQRRNGILHKVSDLINPVDGDWDEDLIKQMFNEKDAEEILQIPISEGNEDWLAWHFDKRGLFSVKSAYRVAIETDARRSIHGIASASGTTADHLPFEWEKIWRLPLPAKILHFLWRMARNSLPLRQKLIQRGVKADPWCPVCLRTDEDGGHTFFKCKPVKHIWRAAQMEDIRKNLSVCCSPKDVLIRIFELDQRKSARASILMWLWWHERNKANKGEAIISTTEILESLEIHDREFDEFCKRKCTKTTTTKDSWWKPLEENYLKINIDRAFTKETKKGGWGFIIRNSEGGVEAAGAGRLSRLSEAIQAETIALLYAAERASELGCRNVIFETDALVLKQAIDGDAYNNSVFGALFREAKFKLLYYFQSAFINLCPRSCNVAAHKLASFSASLVEPDICMWLSNVPNFVTEAVASDFVGPYV